MSKQDLYKCSLILAPATIEEQTQFEGSLYALYVLYRNPNTQEIQIGIPSVENHTSLHNMDIFEKAKEKAYFLNLGYNDIDIAELINDRPIYMIESSENKTIDSITVVNGIDVRLEDVLNGTFKFGKIKRIKKSDK